MPRKITFADRLLLSAHSYGVAAEQLARLNDGLSAIELPLSHIISMTLELSLKAAIVKLGGNERDCFDIGHNLVKACEGAVSRGFRPENEALLRRCCEMIWQVQSKQESRYPAAGKKLRVPLATRTLPIMQSTFLSARALFDAHLGLTDRRES